MSKNSQLAVSQLVKSWQMPLVPENYDRSPLTEEERWALEQYATFHGSSREALAARKILTRFDPPIADVFHLRHKGGDAEDRIWSAHRYMRIEMYRLGKSFWEWDASEWAKVLCPSAALFYMRVGHHCPGIIRMVFIDAAYLFGNINNFRQIGIQNILCEVVKAAQVYFGNKVIAEQCRKIQSILEGKGYSVKPAPMEKYRFALCMLFLLNRTPYLEDISEEQLDVVAAGGENTRYVVGRLRVALQSLKIIPPKEIRKPPHHFNNSGVAPEWYEWCMAWHEQVQHIPNAEDHVSRILAIGRWLNKHASDVRAPEQWTEDLALRFRSDLCSWTKGQYVSERGQQKLAEQNRLGKLLGPNGIHGYLATLRLYLTDLMRRPHAVSGAPARRITLDFAPKEVLTTPAQIRRALDEVHPRDINLRVWAKLTIAAATLAESDLPKTPYTLSFYRAVGLVWVTSARRPNEIIRLRLNCLREEWDPDMRDEDDNPVPRMITSGAGTATVQSQQDEKIPKIYYLHIPSGKNRGPFWIWVPDYTAEAINTWMCERPRLQDPLLDSKDREDVDYLFCYRNKQVGETFINKSLIPTLCAKAGVDISDAKGRISGHRGRSTRLTLLRNRGVSLDDLAEYAGHADTRTIRRYANQDPILLHRVIRDADDSSRIIEGVLDLQVAAQALPALRWFIGYDADGEPMYCGNQNYVTCPHRLECKRCGMFIGGEKARLLHSGENVISVASKVPMTPLETCVVNGDEKGTKACQAALQQLPTPEAPDVALIFNPVGLSNHELEKLAQLGTAAALDKLRQALSAHEQRLTEIRQHKTGRSALVTAQKQRVIFIQKLIADCEQDMGKQ